MAYKSSSVDSLSQLQYLRLYAKIAMANGGGAAAPPESATVLVERSLPNSCLNPAS